MKRHRFRVLCGSHREQGTTYQAGDIVETVTRLDELFGKDSFEYLGTRQVMPSPSRQEPDELEAVEEAVSVRIGETEDNADKEIPEPQQLVAKHVGGGRWKVIDARTDEPIHEGTLTKEEAKELAE